MQTTTPPVGLAADGAARHRQVGLTDEQVLRLYQTMLLARALDERMWILSRQGKAHFILTSRGHEAAQVFSAAALRPGHDYVLTYYRSMAAALQVGVTAEEIMLSVLARASDPLAGGRQLPNHFGPARLRMPTTSSSVGTQLPHAVGCAYAARVLGTDALAVAYFGDGATSKGDFHEALNFAAVWKLPVVFFCENNGWAISVPLDKQTAAPIHRRGAGYGMPGRLVDGRDGLAVYAATRQAVERARAGQGPTLIEARVARLVPHSSDDDDGYRHPRVVKQAQRRDPLPFTRRYLEQVGLLDSETDQRLQERARQAALAAQEQAERAPAPRAEEAKRHLYREASGT